MDVKHQGISIIPQCKVQILTKLINVLGVGIGKVYESVYLKGVCESGLSSDKQKHPYVTRKSDSRKLLGANPNPQYTNLFESGVMVALQFLELSV